ncbi:hypothetical protein EIP86_006388, partial [Pleurotus ostreatoroseus]
YVDGRGMGMGMKDTPGTHYGVLDDGTRLRNIVHGALKNPGYVMVEDTPITYATCMRRITTPSKLDVRNILTAARPHIGQEATIQAYGARSTIYGHCTRCNVVLEIRRLADERTVNPRQEPTAIPQTVQLLKELKWHSAQRTGCLLRMPNTKTRTKHRRQRPPRSLPAISTPGAQMRGGAEMGR